MKVFGVLLLVAGITEVVHAVIVRNLRGFALHLLSAVLYLIAGLFMLEDPILRGSRAHAISLGILSRRRVPPHRLFASRRFPSWPWVLLNGAVDLILGVLICENGPNPASGSSVCSLVSNCSSTGGRG